MREKIERFSKGKYDFEQPQLQLSTEEISITVETGKVYEGSFTIGNTAGRVMKGVVYSSSRLLVLQEASFGGAENLIHYRFNAVYLKAGETHKGELHVVSDCGESTIPFIIQTEVPYCMTSLGKTKDLFQFTNLARMDWSEAKKVFRSEDFERIFLSNEDRYRFIYQKLIKNISTSQALEEFLITIHKKSPIRLNIDKTYAEYQVKNESFLDKLTLTKDHWGYSEIRVHTDAPFIELEQKFLWADRFIGNTYQMFYRINAEKLKPGNHFGHIWITTAYQTIQVSIQCKCSHEDGAENRPYDVKYSEYALIENYLHFRLNRIDLVKYLENTEDIMNEIPSGQNEFMKFLLKLHMAILSGKRKQAENLLSSLPEDETIRKEQSIPEYCAYLYLIALYRKEEAVTDHAAQTIRKYYENGYNDWSILWFLLYTDKRYEKNKEQKLLDIKEQFELGCHSPILYFEAVQIYNEEPFLLRELTQFEIQAINFGIRNYMISQETALQYAYLTNKRKTMHPLLYRGLTRLYDEYDTKEILSAICCMLIKGFKRSEKYFHWYRLAVEAQLRITELYEYYMYTVSDTMQEMLPQPILLYFIYNSSLNDSKKAFLYANVVKYKDKIDNIYHSYYKQMELFSFRMLEAHEINRNLAVLYQEFVLGRPLTSELAKHLPYVIYRYDLECSNPNIVSVTVAHRELNIQDTVPIIQGKAQIDLYTKSAELFFQDSHGNRYVESIPHTTTALINTEEIEGNLLPYSNHPKLLLHLFDRYQDYRIVNKNAILLRKKVLEMEGLAEEYYTECLQALIEYYYENYDDELLEYYLRKLDLRKVRPSERNQFLEMMVIRSCYDKVLEAFDEFGYEGISINRLLKLCSGWIISPADQMQQELILSLGYYIFSQGKYDIAILQYLIQHYQGALKDMIHLWQAGRSFELPTHSLDERLITQMLFTESELEYSYSVFLSYYKGISNHTLVRAFLSYFAFCYLVHDRAIAVELFPIMRRELNYEENDICLAAWLKYQSSNQNLTENERIYVEFSIQRLVRKGIKLWFFQNYSSIVTLPEQIRNRYFILYRGNPKYKVYLHYRIVSDKEQDYITERLPNTFLGIHSKEIILYHNEVLEYYITQETAEGEIETQHTEIRFYFDDKEKEISHYAHINRILKAIEAQDDVGLMELMIDYVQQEHIISACFEPILL